MKLLMILVFMMTSFQTFGVTHVKNGDTVKHDGYLFSIEEEKNLRKIKMEHTQLKELRLAQTDFINIQKKQIFLYKEHINNLGTSQWERALIFVGGMVASGLLLYGSSKIIKNIK